MEKATSVTAAFNAGKLPTTQQFNAFIDHLDKNVGLGDEAALSAQGRLLSRDLKDLLDAYKSLLNNKNGDNILQESLFHLSQAQLHVSPELSQQTTHDIQTIHHSLRTLLSKLWSSFTSQSSQLLIDDLFSLIRTSLADAAEVVEGKVGKAKDTLRQVEGEVQEGKRDVLGRDKESLEAERKDPKVAWEHGMDRVKLAGTTAIGTVQSAEEKTEEGRQKLESKLKREYHSIWERAQNDPEYRQALDTLFSLLQTHLHKTLDTASSSDLSSLFDDPTPDQHTYKALELLHLFFERFLGSNSLSLDPLLNHLRSTLSTILRDPQLNAWFDDFFAFARKNLLSSDSSKESAAAERKDLKARWTNLIHSDDQWRDQMRQIKAELKKLEQAICEDGDLNRLKEAQEKLGRDLKNRLRELGGEEEEEGKVKEGVEKAIEEATWFWQDLFKVYLPRGLNMLGSVPIPRTEYKDKDIEFVLENLDITKLNILPSHVYIRNITDIDIQTTAATSTSSSSSKQQLGTLTRIQLQAVQLDLKDVSFWYKDNKHTIITAPTSELTGLLTLTLPPQGLSLDLQIRLIPSLARGQQASRSTLKKYHIVERASVEISDEVEISVKESNHPLLVGVFQPWVRRRIKEALEKTLSVQLRAWVDWMDGLVYDVGMRKEVFEDVGMTGGPAFVAALWSELGKMGRRSGESAEIGIEPTGTGIVVEEKVVVPETTKKKGGGGGFEYETGKKVEERVLAVGVEPQILEGSKRGPLGTGSQPLVRKIEEEVKERVGEPMEEDRGEEYVERAKGMLDEGKKKVEGFKKAVERKEKEEREKKDSGWKSDAFDF